MGPASGRRSGTDCGMRRNESLEILFLEAAAADCERVLAVAWVVGGSKVEVRRRLAQVLQ